MSEPLVISGKDRIKAAKNKKIRSRIKESAHGEAALDAAANDDFISIAKHRLLRRKSQKVKLPEDNSKNIYEEAKENLDHVETKTKEEIEKELRERELAEEAERKRIALEDFERQRLIRMAREEQARFEREERERREREEREEQERLRRLEEERLAKEAEMERLKKEAEERRIKLEQERKEADERARRERKEAYEAKIKAVLDAANQTERDKALKEVGKLTMLDFNTQEEWEAHQREVGKLNILEIVSNFKKGSKKKKNRNYQRRKSITANWSNAKTMIAKFSDGGMQEEVIRFVKPTAVDLSDLELTDPSLMSPTSFDDDQDSASTSGVSVTPDSAVRSQTLDKL